MKRDGHRVQEVQCPVCGGKFDQQVKSLRPKTCSRSCARKLDAVRNGGHAHNFKGGRFKDANGYIRVLSKGHHRADKRGYVLEHLLVIEQKIGRPLRKTEHVHHKNGRRDDNGPENLELWHRKDPPGIRVADYHCPGCRCSEP